MEGLARARGDGIGTVEVARVQVLLDDHEGARRQRHERGGQVVERGDAEAGLAHHVAPDGVRERQPFGLDLREHAGIDGLEADVPGTAGVLAQQPRRVPSGVGDMPGVEAEAHPFGVSVGQEAVDLLVGLDVALRVGMEHESHPGLLAQDAREMAGPLGGSRGNHTPHESGGAADAEPRPRPAGPVTAIFAGNDLCAFGVLDALAEHGLRVPADMSVAGYDNTPVAAFRAVSLTTVEQFATEIGAEAMRSVLGRVKRRDRPARHVMVPPRLIERTTTGPARSPGRSDRLGRSGRERSVGQ